MTNVLFIESGVYGGGSFTSLLKHLAVLDQDRIKPTVVFFNDNDFIQPLRDKGIKVYIVTDSVFSTAHARSVPQFFNKLFMKGYWRLSVIPLLNFLHQKSIREIERICLTEKIDSIHLNTELFRDRIGLLTAAKLRIPVYSQLRSKYQKNKIYYNPDFISFANQHVTQYLAVSQDTMNFWSEEVGLDRSKFTVLNDYVTIHSEENECRPFPKEKLSFLCVANLIPVKNHFYILHCLHNILLQTNSKLLLVGKGAEEYVTELKKEVKKLGLVDHVEFLGYQSLVEGCIKKADMVLLFSHSEGLPNIVLEAMTLGSIVMATEVGGIPEIIKNDLNGFLVPLSEVRKTEEIIKSVLELSVEKQKSIRVLAKETVVNQYSAEIYRQKTNHLYG